LNVIALDRFLVAHVGFALAILEFVAAAGVDVVVAAAAGPTVVAGAGTVGAVAAVGIELEYCFPSAAETDELI
jgi:predicted Fe-Mo cluster-binding NifX family protein